METHHGWVRKSLLQELAELNGRMEGKNRGLATYLKTQHGEKWFQHFHGKTKKAIWSELTQDGQVYPSLSTLYTHIRNFGLEQVLEGYFSYRDVATVTRILELNDIKLTSVIYEIRELEHLVEQKEQYVRRQAVA